MGEFLASRGSDNAVLAAALSTEPHWWFGPVQVPVVDLERLQETAHIAVQVMRQNEAAEVRDRLLTLEPDFSLEQAVQRSPFIRPEDVARYAEGLRRAGLL